MDAVVGVGADDGSALDAAGAVVVALAAGRRAAGLRWALARHPPRQPDQHHRLRPRWCGPGAGRGEGSTPAGDQARAPSDAVIG